MRYVKTNNARMWIIAVAIVSIGLVLSLWHPQAATAQSITQSVEATTIAKKNTLAPDFTVEMFDGTKISLRDLRGKVVLVNFWATWCPPCREELSYVQKDIIDKFKNDDFVFIPISRGETRQAVESFRKRMGYNFPMGLDTDQSIFGKFATNFIPRNFLINRSGLIVDVTVGFDKDEFAQLINNIETTINKK